jgi:hypothetical protein
MGRSMIDGPFPLDVLEAYIPLKFIRHTDSEYFEYLVRSLEHNYYAEYFNFALLPLHMIYMGIVYHYIYGIYKANHERFKCVMIGFERDFKNIDNLSWQEFSKINERTIFDFYKAVGVPQDKIIKMKKIVDVRNDCVHANGIILSSYEELEKHVDAYFDYLETINEFCKEEFQKLYLEYLNEIKIDVEDVKEAKQYLEDDFFQKYGLNIAIINDLSQVPLEKYPVNTHTFFTAINQIAAFYMLYNKETRY